MGLSLLSAVLSKSPLAIGSQAEDLLHFHYRPGLCTQSRVFSVITFSTIFFSATWYQGPQEVPQKTTIHVCNQQEHYLERKDSCMLGPHIWHKGELETLRRAHRFL